MPRARCSWRNLLAGVSVRRGRGPTTRRIFALPGALHQRLENTGSHDPGQFAQLAHFFEQDFIARVRFGQGLTACMFISGYLPDNSLSGGKVPGCAALMVSPAARPQPGRDILAPAGAPRTPETGFGLR